PRSGFFFRRWKDSATTRLLPFRLAAALARCAGRLAGRLAAFALLVTTRRGALAAHLGRAFGHRSTLAAFVSTLTGRTRGLALLQRRTQHARTASSRCAAGALVTTGTAFGGRTTRRAFIATGTRRTLGGFLFRRPALA